MTASRELDRAALVISYSDIANDPRVRRQIDWLVSTGMRVDTLGLGARPPEKVRSHFTIDALPRWASTLWGAALIHLLLPGSLQFRILGSSRIPRELRARLVDGGYDVAVFNEYEFTPWPSDRRLFDPERMRIHLDLHEFREPGRRGRSRWARLTQRHYRWVRRHIGSSAFTSRSTVSSGIAAQYEHEFGFAPMTVIRSTPDYVDQQPSDVDPEHIRLLYHGMAAWSRGLPQIAQAVAGLPDRFDMTFMLTEPRSQIDRLRSLIDELGIASRARIVPAVPMREVAQRINEYDLELIFFPPISTNIEFALPNKIFEAIQGRLGLVIGRSPMLVDVVERYGNGVIAEGWDPEDLRAALDSLDAEHIRRLKLASASAALELNAEREGEAFLRALDLLEHGLR